MYEIFLKGGIVMWPLLFLSVLALAILLHRIFLFNAMKGKNFFELCNILARVQRGADNLFLISSIAPLLGLLGTVFGIIKCFETLSVSQPDSQILSLGLSEALITTAAGLIISIPCFIAGHSLHQQADKIFDREQQKNKAVQ